MTTLDIEADARRAFNAMKAGQISIFPNDTGYALMGGSSQALRTIYETKKRGSHKRHALLSNLDMQRELHALDARSQSIVEAVTQDFDLPLAVIAPFRADHPVMRGVEPELMKAASANGTVLVLLNAGPAHTALSRMSHEEHHAVFGSSANVTGSGPKFRVEDIEPEIRAISDVTIDYGLRKYHIYNRSGTVIRFPEVEVVRIGICYELIVDVMKRQFGIELPPDPGLTTNPSGHLQEFALLGVE